MIKSVFFSMVVLFNLLLLVPSHATTFMESLGEVSLGSVIKSKTGLVKIPVITWGADMVTFHANGGLKTTKNSIFGRLGLNIELVIEDSLQQQTKNYIQGQSPFLRGTARMIGQVTEAIAQDKITQGIMILQLSWSAGDHFVFRKGIHRIKELKDKKIALQKNGPHIGMLDDILRIARLSWDDVDVVWTNDLTGSADSPAELFRSNDDIAAAFTITPDMIGLTGGLNNVGDGEKRTVSGARVLASTAYMQYSIADVYIVRSDFYQKNKPWIEKFVMGYLRAVDEVVVLTQKYATTGSKEIIPLFEMTQNIYGSAVIPTLEDAYGLLSDATLSGYSDNQEFFRNNTNSHGFRELMKRSLELSKRLEIIKTENHISNHDLDYNIFEFNEQD